MQRHQMHTGKDDLRKCREGWELRKKAVQRPWPPCATHTQVPPCDSSSLLCLPWVCGCEEYRGQRENEQALRLQQCSSSNLTGNDLHFLIFGCNDD